MLIFLLACTQDYELAKGPVDVNPGDVTECDFTRVEDTSFYSYDCNPVFPVGERADWEAQIGSVAFHVTPVMDHPFYQAWYVGIPDGADYGDYALGYAVSANGTDWTAHPDAPLLEAPGQDQWDGDMMDAMQIVWDPETAQYVMLYQGYNIEEQVQDQGWGLGVATSADGVGWQRFDLNPVIDLTEPADISYCWPLTLTLGTVAGFTGYVAGANPAAPNSEACEVYRINASDVATWTPDEEAVFLAGYPDEWDDEGFASMAIAELNGTSYMFYVGFGTWTYYDTYRSGENAFFGYAELVGETWERRGMVPIHTNEEGLVRAVAAQTVGNRIHLWVTDDYDGASAIGYFLFDPEAAAAEDGAGDTE